MVVEVVWGSSSLWGMPAYEGGHILGAVAWDFELDLQDKARQDVVDARPVDMFAAGRVPTAVNLPPERIMDAEGNTQIGWQTPTIHADGTFKSMAELEALVRQKGVTPDQQIITYCVLGGLSTHLWFVLTQLLGYSQVREYDRSWAEWSNLPNVPIEVG